MIDPATGEAVAGAYVAGWIKRGPTGFIGTNKSCAMETVSSLVDDFNAGLLTDPAARPAALDKLIRARRTDVVDAAGWRAIDAAETARGDAEGRPRVKFTEGGRHGGGGHHRTRPPVGPTAAGRPAALRCVTGAHPGSIIACSISS